MWMLDHAMWSYARQADLAGMIATDVLIAGGVTFPKPGATAKTPDSTVPTFERVMGRPPTPFFDPEQLTPEQEAEEAERKRVTAEKLARAQMQMWEAEMRREHPNLVVDETPGEPEPSPPV